VARGTKRAIIGGRKVTQPAKRDGSRLGPAGTENVSKDYSRELFRSEATPEMKKILDRGEKPDREQGPMRFRRGKKRDQSLIYRGTRRKIPPAPAGCCQLHRCLSRYGYGRTWTPAAFFNGFRPGLSGRRAKSWWGLARRVHWGPTGYAKLPSTAAVLCSPRKNWAVMN